jgi:hypothetical protein
MSEPILQVIPAWNRGCQFDKDGLCAAHGTRISEHSSITMTETMTLAEAKRRFPDWAEKLEAKP